MAQINGQYLPRLHFSGVGWQSKLNILICKQKVSQEVKKHSHGNSLVIKNLKKEIFKDVSTKVTSTKVK